MFTPRQEDTLLAIVQEYVQTAEPISSKLLHQKYFSDISPATIRHEMSDLEHRGYLVQPHISSGRVPTDRAYRFLVNRLLEKGILAPRQIWAERIDRSIDQAGQDPHLVNRAVARIVSELSDQAVITNIVDSDDFYKTGLSSLFEFPEFREFERIFPLASFFDRFESMFERMEREIFGSMGSDFEVLIGNENPFREVRDETVIVTKYRLPNRVSGSLTMIGPTRMDYDKNISLVKYTADRLNSIF